MGSPPKSRVLAVDDVPANLIALEAVLGRKYEVVGAKSGAEALELLSRDQTFDVILMDLQMPQMDGYEAATRAKRIPGCEDIPLVFITAVYQEDPHIKRGYEVGAVDYFTKPFDPDILRLKVDVYASFRRRTELIKTRERQLRESEDVLRAGRKLASVLEGLPVGVIIADLGGRVGQMNEEALRIVKSVSAIESDAYGELLEWWERNQARMKHGDSPLARALASGLHSKHQLVSVECVDGTMKNLLEWTSPLRSAAGAIVGAVVVMRDVTETRKHEADFEERVTRLVSLGVELEPVSHEPAG